MVGLGRSHLVLRAMPQRSEFIRELVGKLEDFVAVFLLPLFFAYTGLRTQIGLIGGDPTLWLFCGLILLVAVVGKWGGSTAAAKAVGLHWRESLAVGILMNTRGLTELVILNIGTNGYDLTARVLGGTATKIAPGFIVTAGAGFITRYQRGRAVGGAPNIGMFGVTSNLELEYRVAPILTLSAYAEGALAPFPYAAEARLGLLSDSSEFRARLQLSMDLTASSAIDIGYDFTRWHAAFTQSTFTSDGALLITAREHALTVGFRWKP